MRTRNCHYNSKITAIVYALEICEFLLLDTKHPITHFTDHIPVLSLFAREGSLNVRFFLDQIVITRFPKLVFFEPKVKNFLLPICSLQFCQRNYYKNHKKCLKPLRLF